MHSEHLDPVPWKDAPIYWAQGFLAERLDISVDEADRALRAHADVVRTPLLDVADRVVQFELIADPGTGL